LHEACFVAAGRNSPAWMMRVYIDFEQQGAETEMLNNYLIAAIERSGY